MEIPKIKIIYNNLQLIKYKRKEIAFLKKKKKEIRADFRQKLKNSNRKRGIYMEEVLDMLNKF